MLVSCNDQEASFTIGFVGHRVACENVVGSVCENVTAFHRDWVDEPHLGGFQVHSVALKVGFRDEERRLLEGCQQGFNGSEHGFNYRFCSCFLINHLNLEFIGRCLTKNLCKALVLFQLGLHLRQVDA